QVKNKLSLSYDYLGEQTVKNIPEPVRVYRLVMEDSARQKAKGKRQKSVLPAPVPQAQVSVEKAKVENKVCSTYRSWPVVALAGALLIAGIFIVGRYFLRPSLSPQSSVLSPEAAPAALPLPDKPSIVVMSFTNMSDDPSQEYFSDGITEDITS